MSYYDDLCVFAFYGLPWSCTSLVVIFCRMEDAYIGFDILAFVIQ